MGGPNRRGFGGFADSGTALPVPRARILVASAGAVESKAGASDNPRAGGRPGVTSAGAADHATLPVAAATLGASRSPDFAAMAACLQFARAGLELTSIL